MADPISLALGAGGALLGSLFGGGKKKEAAPMAAPAPPPAAPPIQNPTGSAKSNKPAMTPSFIGAAAAPEQRSFGQKTLIGQ